MMFGSRLWATENTHTTTILRFSEFCRRQPGWAGTRRNIHPLTPIVAINHPLFASSICYDSWHPLCSICLSDSLFPQSLSKFSLVYFLAWHHPLHTSYISSPNHCLLFAAHAHTIATCTERMCLWWCQIILGFLVIIMSVHTHAHAHIHNRFTTLLDFVWDYPGVPAPER